MKLLSSEIILIIIKLFDIKHSDLQRSNEQEKEKIQTQHKADYSTVLKAHKNEVS